MEGSQPRETMEQFMYTYLNQRYGLKPLIIEWASAIIAAIQKYSRECADVCLFGKVLRNEIDEDFRFVQSALKDTAHTLLRQMVRERYPLKGEGELKGMIEEVSSDKAGMDNAQWYKIIERMYDEQDIKVLEEKIRENAKTRLRNEISKKLNRKALSPSQPVLPHGKTSSRMTSGTHTTHNLRLTREEQLHLEQQLSEPHNGTTKVYFTDFLKTLMDFQMRQHESYLRAFTKLFRQVDADSDGIITEEQFEGLLHSTGIFMPKETVSYFLQVLDPFNLKRITFSECVQLFSAHMVACS